MSWLLLLLAGLFEIVWAFSLKSAEGFTRLWPSVVTITFMLASFGLLGIAMRSLPASTAYAVWVGIGAVGTAVTGMVALGENASIAKILCLLLVVGGVMGLKYAH